jgi:hypothetical protein
MAMKNHTEVHHCEFTSTYPNPEPDLGPNPYQARATKSTIDAITHLLNYCATHLDAVLQLEEMGHPQPPAHVRGDNSSAICIVA